MSNRSSNGSGKHPGGTGRNGGGAHNGRANGVSKPGQRGAARAVPSPAPGRAATAARHAGPAIGMVEWFRPGEHDRADRVLDDLQALGVRELRTGISWADWHTPEGEAWYAWLFPQLARRASILPCFLYTPPSWDLAPTTSAPPRDAKSYADFLDQMVTRFGKHFEWVELWNEPNNLREWDVTLDPYWVKFSEMVGAAAYWVRQRGKKAVLGGSSRSTPTGCG